ncbi:MAG: anaerobic ribonucleoside-triphosphate reductase activating protein [Spirochaetales bacterium]|nr:MAG: anaerobic ribonucleoside-triphosphate reductase activating protein [Spirochaetales bacterium]
MALDKVGLIKTTLVDFPGEVAATVFTPGCNLRCGFCHNPELLSPPYPETLLPVGEVKRFLEKRKHLLGGVCLTGGEPLLHEEIYDLADYIKSLGLKVKLDTNGTFPDRLAFDSLDYIAMDVKTRPSKYTLLGGAGASADTPRAVAASIERILAAGSPAGHGTDYEFRTTLVPGFVDADDIRELCRLLAGARLWVLAPFDPKKTLDPILSETLPYSAQETAEMADIIRSAGIPVKVRGEG